MARPRSEEAKQKVLNAAQDVVGDLSVDGFTVEEVAKRSGVAKTTIYRHWPNGNRLMIEALGCMVHTFPTPNTGSLAGDLEAFMGNMLPVVSDPKLMQAMLGVVAAAASDPEIAEIHASMMAEQMGPIVTIIDLAKGRGELPADLDTNIILDVIEGPFFIRKMIRREPIDEATLRQMVTIIVAGLTSFSLETAEL
jgi:AcrR family transcriptional regulator